MSSFKVVLDTSVLFPNALRDTLLRMAQAELYRGHWTEDILRELRGSLVGNGKMNEAQANYLTNVMKKAFPAFMISKGRYEKLIDQMENDPKDRHVLAAAVAEGAQIIITNNIKHFPVAALSRYNIQAKNPDDFLLDQLSLDPDIVIQILHEQAADLKNPPKTFDDILSALTPPAPNFVNEVKRIIREDDRY
jgi:predicted nucleic acid-binding protein